MTRRCIGLFIILALVILVMLFAAEAQQPTHVHRIGVLLGAIPERTPPVGAFLEGLHDLGYVEGQNLVIEYRGVEGQHERFPDLVAELVRLQVDVLVVSNRICRKFRF